MPRDSTRHPSRIPPKATRPDRDVSRPLPSSLSWITLVVFASGLAAATVAWRLPVWVPIAYGALSILTFLVYAIDKSAARRTGQRVSEQTLLTLGVVGGWPGALVAQQSLRHKTRKRTFRRPFWATVVVNVVLLGVIVTMVWGG